MRTTGRYETTTTAGEKVDAFVPEPLPPVDPALTLDVRMHRRLVLAERSLARLELAGELVPSMDWFLYAFIRKEAVTSSQIEGTQATLVDLLTFEATEHVDDASAGDINDVCNYLEAIQYARQQMLGEDGLPLSMLLLNETHRRLMQGARGEERQPGEIRITQNWIGGTRPGNAVYVPPPPQLLGDLLGDLEKYIHGGNDLPPLVRAGLVHVQFETIHPYLDGNGRIGRMLITLLLEHWGLLAHPLLYLSLYFKRRRDEYYRLLGKGRTEGDWESWCMFFLDGVTEISVEAVNLARDLFTLVTGDRQRLISDSSATMTAIRLFECLPLHPIVTVSRVVRVLDTSKPTAIKAISILERSGVLTEITGRKRDRTFTYTAYLERLRTGTG